MRNCKIVVPTFYFLNLENSVIQGRHFGQLNPFKGSHVA
jgi:hypothetical protein